MKKNIIKVKSQETPNDNSKKNSRSAMYLSTFLSFCFLAIGFERYKDIKTKGYYVEHKYQVVINGSDGIITVYALFLFGSILLIYSIYLLYKENNEK
jgi:hypothetical protein